MQPVSLAGWFDQDIDLRLSHNATFPRSSHPGGNAHGGDGRDLAQGEGETQHLLDTRFLLPGTSVGEHAVHLFVQEPQRRRVLRLLMAKRTKLEIQSHFPSFCEHSFCPPSFPDDCAEA